MTLTNVAQQVVMQSTKESKPVKGISHKFPKTSLEASTLVQRFKPENLTFESPPDLLPP